MWKKWEINSDHVYVSIHIQQSCDVCFKRYSPNLAGVVQTTTSGHIVLGIQHQEPVVELNFSPLRFY